MDTDKIKEVLVDVADVAASSPVRLNIDQIEALLLGCKDWNTFVQRLSILLTPDSIVEITNRINEEMPIMEIDALMQELHNDNQQ